MAQLDGYNHTGVPDSYLENSFDYRQFLLQSPKTPASLYNHSGLSPVPSGPISTPHSRHNSQPPEGPSEQMNWSYVPDDSHSSNSPTSVRTPEDSIFDQDMQDAPQEMPGFYQFNGGLPTQMPQEVDMNDPLLFGPFSEPGGTLHYGPATLMATFNSVPQPIDTQFNTHMENQASGNGMALMDSQPYNHLYGTAYTRQPTQHDPWNTQAPPRNPNEPQPDIALWDPVTAPQIIDQSVYIQEWTHNSTDPSILVPPNAPTAPPLDHHQLYLDRFISPLPMELTSSSGGTSSYSGDHNFNPTQQYFQELFMGPQSFSSPGASLNTVGINSTNVQAPLSPYQQTPVSPYQVSVSSFPAAQSPSSDTVFPQQDSGLLPSTTSDHGIILEQPERETKEREAKKSPQPIHAASTVANRSSSLVDTTPERVLFGPEPAAQRSQPRSTAGKPPGGRAVGTHLEPEVAEAAHNMRRIVACWHCVLQRDKCGPGDTCERCLKRSQRPNADCGVGCSRVKLVELTECFIPSFISTMHGNQKLEQFVASHIHQWGNREMTIILTAGEAGLPRIPVQVYEFLPKTKALVEHIQYKTDLKTHKRYPVVRKSPPLGMMLINYDEEKKYDRYVNEIVDNHLDAFEKLCWMEDDNDFQEKLFHLLARFKPRNDEEVRPNSSPKISQPRLTPRALLPQAKLLREVLRLLVVTFIMGHTLTLAEESKHFTLSRMHSYTSPADYIPNFTSSRMTTRQLKYFFQRIHTSILKTLLNKLQQTLKSSKGCDKWAIAFIIVLGLAMASEEQQKTVHLVMETNAHSGELRVEEARRRAEDACKEIDRQFRFVMMVFRWKYMRKVNPIRDADLEWEGESGFGGGFGGWVREVAGLVRENNVFLSTRQFVDISHDNQIKYTSRLVGRFLLSFWTPS
ncbi:hypothetical protein GQ43DRAFT_463734 [Delitschia confertaspora ATCC 74209]|uniref:Uncharacterized protein n=1 Tax=Delitschia confertaspora ATCC 74209 TaxID=1513339 RepID=A0A9P4MYC2_9PLEO|nr:hypothetical protein GQ43DRAFT_463734 [Delitschia confertaspora ATCC 74209]